MNNVFKITLAAALIMSAASTAQAASSGDITFTGLIISDTCDITIDGGTTSTGNKFTVTFPPTSPANYTGDGDVGATKEFTMQLSDCEPGTVTGVNAAFTGTSSDTANEILDVTDSDRHVGIRLYSAHNNGGEKAVKFNGSRPADADFADFVDDGNGNGKKGATLKYIAKVVQVGVNAPTPGNYTANATYELVYN